MQNNRMFSVMVLALLAIPCAAQVLAGNPDDEAAIRKVLDRFEEAFEKRDAKLYASVFAEDADWENAFGGREHGRTAIEARLTGVYQMFQKAEQTIKETRIRLVTPDVAVVDVDRDIVGQISAGGDRRLPPRKVRTTSILRKTDGNWLVVVFRVADLRDSREVR